MVTAVILTPARVEGRVWAALHYVDPVNPDDQAACPKLVFRLHETLLLPLETPCGVFLGADKPLREWRHVLPPVSNLVPLGCAVR